MFFFLCIIFFCFPFFKIYLSLFIHKYVITFWTFKFILQLLLCLLIFIFILQVIYFIISVFYFFFNFGSFGPSCVTKIYIYEAWHQVLKKFLKELKEEYAKDENPIVKSKSKVYNSFKSSLKTV